MLEELLTERQVVLQTQGQLIDLLPDSYSFKLRIDVAGEPKIDVFHEGQSCLFITVLNIAANTLAELQMMCVAGAFNTILTNEAFRAKNSRDRYFIEVNGRNVHIWVPTSQKFERPDAVRVVAYFTQDEFCNAHALSVQGLKRLLKDIAAHSFVHPKIIGTYE